MFRVFTVRYFVVHVHRQHHPPLEMFQAIRNYFSTTPTRPRDGADTMDRYRSARFMSSSESVTDICLPGATAETMAAERDAREPTTGKEDSENPEEMSSEVSVRSTAPPRSSPNISKPSEPRSGHIPSSGRLPGSNTRNHDLGFEIVGINAVRDRRTRKMRETKITIHYFSSLGTKRIRIPPRIPREKGIQVDDLYIHQSHEGYQSWRCTAVDPEVSWEDLPLLTEMIGEEGETRKFVITETGLPGWVSKSTVDKKYKEIRRMDGSGRI
ncbi:hypothetical protein BDY19DRAFT_906367 [Irpex rosettiformis]|uniref:Uncharacterized protein n=1 Tax=Irpex rosettiformis TaxID=378272 RepID=A0ACB8U3R9_9APHY|nr:hypothetical protein BDY19DRAFT_906367 [Irpex rosettiformis]